MNEEDKNEEAFSFGKSLKIDKIFSHLDDIGCSCRFIIRFIKNGVALKSLIFMEDDALVAAAKAINAMNESADMYDNVIVKECDIEISNESLFETDNVIINNGDFDDIINKASEILNKRNSEKIKNMINSLGLGCYFDDNL